MGLDITVHPLTSALAVHDCDSRSEECYDAGHVPTYAYRGFEQSLRGVGPLTGDPEHEDMVVGPWHQTDREKTWSFRAGSYSGYTAFRRALAKAAWGFEVDYATTDVESLRDLPFFELIYFADNEGTIGPEAAADLAADFVEYGERVAPQLDGWHVESYVEWTRAFQAAADAGLVEFH